MQTILESKKKINHIEESALSDMIYSRKYNALAQSNIEEFNQKYFQALLSLKDNDIDYNYDIYFQNLAEFSTLVNKNLAVKNKKDYQKILAIIGMADVVLNQGIENNDFETLTAAFSSLKIDLKTFNFLK